MGLFVVTQRYYRQKVRYLPIVKTYPTMDEFILPYHIILIYDNARSHAWCYNLYNTFCDACGYSKEAKARGKFPTVKEFVEYSELPEELVLRKLRLKK
jgi:pullulanase/glycogen debranching enzyme